MAQRAQLGAGWVPQLPGTPATPAQGALLYVKSDGVLYTKNVAGTESAVNPTGTILMWPTATAPGGYLLCQGGTFQSTTYSALATLLGDTYGTHTGTTYYLPDFRARSPVGVGGAAVPAVGGNAYSLGQKWGHEKMQQHSHTVTQSPHSHAIDTMWSSYSTHNHYQSGYVSQGSDPYQGWGTAYTGAINANVSINNTGTGNMENVHPVLGINFVIKT